MRFDEEMFTGMRYKIFGMPGDQSVFSVYPELAQRKEMHIKPPKAKSWDTEYITGDQILRYIIYLYDPGSPLGGIDNLEERKEEALELSGIDMTATNRYGKYMDMVIGGTLPEFNNAVIAFLRIVKMPLWSTMKAAEKLFYYKLQQVEDPNSRVKMRDVTTSRKELDQLVDEYFAGATSESLIEKFYDYINQEDVEISVEDVVKKLNAGEEIFPEIEAYDFEQAGIK